MVSTVAIVDDEPRIRELYTAWLDEQYEVVAASNGETALEVIDDDVDVVLLDRRMPGLSGDDVLSRLRDRDYTGWVVMVTAVNPDVDIAAMAFDDYLVKPVDKETIRRAVEVVDARSRYDRDVRSYFQVLAKRQALEETLSDPALSDNEAYAQLKTEERELKARLDESVDRLTDRGLRLATFQ